MKSKNIKRLYQQVMPFLPKLTYVDVGARAVKHNRFVLAFPQARYIGFDLDVEECKRLNALNIERHQFYSQALGRKSEMRTLYVTRNPASSSLYEPNSLEMYRFMEYGSYFDVLEKKIVETVGLDDWCRNTDLSGIEFLELDTQGSELDILQGSEHLLATSALGLQVEVEFFPLYKDQPLFSDIDSYLQSMGFLLFDLSRYRFRRANIKTRGQLLWGHAFYLRDIRKMENRQPSQLLTLAAIASFYGFEDYALEVVTSLTAKKSAFGLYEHKEKIMGILESYCEQLTRPSKRGIQRFWKKASNWRVTPKKDYGYFIKD